MPEILQIKPTVSVRIFCPICIWSKNKSKKFSTVYSLKYHLSAEHQGDLYPENLTLDNVREILLAIEKAIQIGMVRNS